MAHEQQDQPSPSGVTTMATTPPAMPTSPTQRIFLSSTSVDLQRYAEITRQRLQALGCG